MTDFRFISFVYRIDLGNKLTFVIEGVDFIICDFFKVAWMMCTSMQCDFINWLESKSVVIFNGKWQTIKRKFIYLFFFCVCECVASLIIVCIWQTQFIVSKYECVRAFVALCIMRSGPIEIQINSQANTKQHSIHPGTMCGCVFTIHTAFIVYSSLKIVFLLIWIMSAVECYLLSAKSLSSISWCVYTSFQVSTMSWMETTR